ncbi:hypothetical protein CATMQ487_13800 [Sphaerotilus microaerophilus]|uniref:Uncharacterized protein n=1 Tax=Sphaerotilus microaerophilus TaxID=2914710 RepID=A0ABM7YJD8_9BURK|nr:hypothetical protein CATMQ487_13800 [Sphaerotilus sp. FB-5]
MSVNADVALNVPSPDTVAKESTWPWIGCEDPSRRVAVTVTGAIDVTVEEESANVSEGAPVTALL